MLTKVHIVKAMVFSSSHVRACELNCKEGRAPKKWCFQTVVLEKALESPLDCKEIKPVNPKGNQPWIFTGRTDAETPILCSLDEKSQLTGKDPDAGKDWKQKKRVTEDEMVGWHRQVNGHELGPTPGDCEGQGGLVCCSLWCGKESDTTRRLNNNNQVASNVLSTSAQVRHSPWYQAYGKAPRAA